MPGFDEAVSLLRGWQGEDVVVRLDPDGSVMRGVLREIDAAGLDGAAFALQDPARDAPATGVAVALFRDAATLVEAGERHAVVAQGRVRITVRRSEPS
jgi:hypothetical protein